MAAVTGIADRRGLYCRICGKALAPEDVAGELGENVFCDVCVESSAYMNYLAAEHAKNKREMAAHIKPQEPRHTRTWFFVCGTTVIIAQIAVLLFVMPPSLPSNRHAAVEGPRVAMINDLDVCLEQMWLQVKALEQYKIDNGAYPASLDALVPKYLDEPFVHPITKAPYIYSRDGEYYLLEMPNPEIHDIKALTCDGRGGPPHIWLDESK